MTPFEMTIAGLLLIMLLPAGWKIGKHIADRFSFDKKKKDNVLREIENILQDGLNSLNAASMTPQELKKLKIKKDKFLIKASQLILEISRISNKKLIKQNFTDKLLGENVEVDILENMNGSIYYSDYIFAFSIIKNLIENTEFPKKDDYLALNNLYKKYKKLNKENKHGK
jgi:hypothetical protein